MHIMHVAPFPFPSPQGSQVYVKGLLVGLQALGMQGRDLRLSLACYGHGLGTVPPGIEILRAPLVPGYRRMRAGPDVIKPALDLALAAKLARHRPDVLHVHNYEGPIVGALARLRHRLPMVYSAHTTMELELPSYFSSRWAKALSARLGWGLDRAIPRQADVAVALSHWGAARLEAFGCARVEVIPPGVDQRELGAPVPLRAGPGPWVVYAGNPDAYQELDHLVAAMARVPARLLLVSASSLARFRGIPRVHCVETSAWTDVRRWIAGSDVAAIPRAVCPGFPVKLLNYLGLGLPVVGVRGAVPPLPGVVTAEAGSWRAMGDEIAALIADPGRARELGAAGQRHVAESCTLEARAAQLYRIYRDLVDLPGGASRA